ncbi:hypothetical protein NC653_009049 [Populus alba x Populus x berolinensis]|uniref:Uncharacterized protein n=1 Tax=Populus alba x Populus x berolinensis TaxID=444605 RepID=A0AAD6W977_9ROSI|nr:hypothetical protein NC653_009049 [Populus alba x Populus x berolinensis]
MKVRSIMVTGDNWGTANSIAKEVGIETVIAEAKPEEKAEKVKELQALQWAMVGRMASNDSPALCRRAVCLGMQQLVQATDIAYKQTYLEDLFPEFALKHSYGLLGSCGALFSLSAPDSVYHHAGLLELPIGSNLHVSVVSRAPFLRLKNYRRPKKLENLNIHGI